MRKTALFSLVTAILFLVSINLSADTINLLSNPGFATPAAGVPPGTYVNLYFLCNRGGRSAAADWNVWSNGCAAKMSTKLERSTLPGDGDFMIKVTTTRSDGGLVQEFPSSSVASATASAWVWVIAGCVGIGAGDDGFTPIATSTCTHSKWIHLTTPNSSSPVTEFIVYDTLASTGATFFVDNASVSVDPTPEPAPLALLGAGLFGLAVLVRRKGLRVNI